MDETSLFQRTALQIFHNIFQFQAKDQSLERIKAGLYSACPGCDHA
jgi:hypothetical protein